jgi:hypothetical protein
MHEEQLCPHPPSWGKSFESPLHAASASGNSFKAWQGQKRMDSGLNATYSVFICRAYLMPNDNGVRSYNKNSVKKTKLVVGGGEGRGERIFEADIC